MPISVGWKKYTKEDFNIFFILFRSMMEMWKMLFLSMNIHITSLGI